MGVRACTVSYGGGRPSIALLLQSLPEPIRIIRDLCRSRTGLPTHSRLPAPFYGAIKSLLLLSAFVSLW